MSLKIQNLHVSREGKEIVKGVSIEIRPGEVHALMGPNGSGKSTFANALMGNAQYVITGGTISVDDTDITKAATHERAKAGLFLSMQHTPEIPGVSLGSFLRTAWNALKGQKIGPLEFKEKLEAKMTELQMDLSFAKRALNEGFSGGEKKRAEILQLAMLEPKYAVLDETDSGLDVDALRTVGEGIMRLKDTTGFLIVTHNPKLLAYLAPDRVHAMADGKVVAEGGPELAAKIEKEGFDTLAKTV